jgi:hypothetical protein
MKTNGNENTVVAGENERPAWIDLVQSQVSSLRFGQVQIVVHDSHVVQIERTEKVRLNRDDE